MSISRAIADAIKQGIDPVDFLKDYLEEKDSRLTRVQAAGMMNHFNVQVNLLIQKVQDGHAILPCVDRAFIEIAWLRLSQAGQDSLAEILENELRARGKENNRRPQPNHHQ